MQWKCNCFCPAFDRDLFVPPAPAFSCLDYCGGGGSACGCSTGFGGFGGGSIAGTPAGADCETGEVFFDVGYYIPGCLGSPTVTTHHQLGGYGIYSLLPS